MFGKSRIKPGEYVFVVQADQNYNKLIIGIVLAINGSRIHVRGSYIRPIGLIERVRRGHTGDRPKEVLTNPDPNNCIFML